MALPTPPSHKDILQQDLQDLHQLGYPQQLLREMGGFANFAISFSIISVLTGAILLYGFGLRLAGPVINTVGWPLVSVFTLIVAASMAELASAYPTAGGLYFWAYRLGGRTWAWVTAWFNMIGQITITAGINIAAAIYLVGAVTRAVGLPADTPLPLFGSLTNWYFYVLVMALIMIPQMLINIFGIKLTARLNEFSVWWHLGGVVLIIVLLGVLGRTHQPLSFAFQFTNLTNPYQFASVVFPDGSSAPALYLGDPVAGQTLVALPSPLFAMFSFLTPLYQAAPLWLVFAIGLLQAQWTYTGYDASAHVAEETVMARLNSAWGVFLSVAASAVIGYALLMALTLSITDLPATATDAYPVLKIAYDSLSPLWANVVAVVIAGAMWLCGLSSLTSMSRMWFAFARDGGMPGHHWLRQVHPRWRTPVNAIWLTCALVVIMLLWSGAYYIVTAISVIFLYWAYGLPIFLNLRHKLRGHNPLGNAPWSLKRWGAPLNALAVIWILLLTLFMVIPPNELVLWTTALLCGFMFVYWQMNMKHHFTGPRPASEEEMRRLEAELASAVERG